MRWVWWRAVPWGRRRTCGRRGGAGGPRGTSSSSTRTACNTSSVSDTRGARRQGGGWGYSTRSAAAPRWAARRRRWRPPAPRSAPAAGATRPSAAPRTGARPTPTLCLQHTALSPSHEQATWRATLCAYSISGEHSLLTSKAYFYWIQYHYNIVGRYVLKT